MYDGLTFGFRPENELACGIVSMTAELDEDSALETANHAQSVFNQLKSESPEFSLAVIDRTFRISIMSSYDLDARELCRVVDGKIEWKR